MREATWRWIAGSAPSVVERVVELGPGSGKYTELVLERTAAEVDAYEISDAFLECLAERCAPFLANGRLRAERIGWTDNEGLLRAYGRAHDVDVVLAIDVLMMMDWQSALVYLVSAANMLRPGGRVLATFADAGSRSGFDRMMRDLGRHSASDPAPCTRFHWVNLGLLEEVLPRLGFGRIDVVHGPERDLDIARLYLSAELVDPALAVETARHLAPVGGDSTNRVGTLA